MELIIKILQFFLCFTILVGIHELGHFIMARVFRIRVEKFYIFFDPWFSLFKFRRGNTEYGLGWLPLGGYVKIAGMIDESMDKEYQQREVQPWEFRAKPAWQRFLVMIAGVVMNVLLAITIYIGICYTWGETYFPNDEARWGYNFNEAGHRMGFRDGDRFVSIDGEKVDDVSMLLNQLLITESDREVVVLRDGKQVTLHLTLDELIDMRREKGYENLFTLRMPFLIDSVAAPTAAALQPFELRTQHYTFWQAIPAGIHKTGKVIASYWEQLKLIVQPKTKMYEELGGFIAIGSIFPGSWDWQDFWLKTAFLSIILAVMNILPIPGLDGGHAIFTFWEMISGRKVSDRVLEAAQYVGLIIILFLLLYANGNDVYRFFIK